uniref:Uncharacterized protein n=1 Tax=Arundo donax TaxID=35708 RepID=A0A0A9GGB5_ARUDO
MKTRCIMDPSLLSLLSMVSLLLQLVLLYLVQGNGRSQVAPPLLARDRSCYWLMMMIKVNEPEVMKVKR